MNARRGSTVVILLVMVLGASRAGAEIAKKCKDTTFVFSPTAGCVKRPPAAKLSAAASYLIALDAIESDPKRAFALFDDACRGKHAAACTQLGVMYQTGRGRAVSKDNAKAQRQFERGCELGDGPACQKRGNELTGADPKAARMWFERGCAREDGTACAQLAYFTGRGLGGPEDAVAAQKTYDKSLRLLDKNCPLGNGIACVARGVMYQKGYGVKIDLEKSRASFQLACEAGIGDGCASVAYELDKQKGNEAAALALFERACLYDRADACSTAAGRLADADHNATHPMELAERGCNLDTKQCYVLARLYELGRGGAKPDQQRATSTFKSACDAGDQTSCVSYAKRVRSGLGTTADPAMSTKLLTEACALEEAAGCEQLAVDYTIDKTNDAAGLKAAESGCKLGSYHACYVLGWMTKNNRRGTAAVADAVAAKDALPLFETACDKGSSIACEEAGKQYQSAIGTTEDLTRAVQRFKKACDDENSTRAYSCAALSDLTMAGTGTAKDPDLAIHYSGRACANGHDGACDWLPGHATEPGPLKDVTAQLEPVCAAGNDAVCFALSHVIYNGNSADKKRAIELVKTSCGHKHAPSCLGYADAVYNGWGVDENKAAAEQLYKVQCDDGQGESCRRLSRIARDVKKDAVLGLQYADQGCKLKVADACNEAGYIYYTAQKGVRWDISQAASYYEKACELKSTSACANVGELFRYGIARKRDPRRAYALYKESCDLGSAYGCSGQAHYVATGEGGATKDIPKAIELYRDGCKAETPEACQELADLLESQHAGSPSEIARLRLDAFNMAQKASEANPEYMWRLGTYYRDGMSTMKDPAKASEAFNKACDSFDPLGCITAGQTLATSSSARDREQAKVYFQRACAAGIDDGCQGLSAGASAPPPVHAKGCGCSGDVAPGGELGLACLVFGWLGTRRRREAGGATPRRHDR